jgi:phosphatidylinositol glycan class U
MAASSARWTALMVAALAARVLLVHFGWHAPLASRIELSSPVDSLARLREGAALVEMGLSPYEGSMLHVPPMVLLLFTPFLHVADALGASKAPYASIVRSAPFVALDALVAAALFALAAIYVEAAKDDRRAKKVNDNKHALKTFAETDDRLPHFTACAYLLNPMSVLSCAAGSTSALGVFCVAAATVAACKKKPEPILAGACLATQLFVTADVRVPLLLVYPVATLARDGVCARSVLEEERTGKESRRTQKKKATARFRATLVGFLATCVVLGFISTRAYADTETTFREWTNATYVFAFGLGDLTPNLGIHWYLFAQIFAHFRMFFLVVFHAFPAFLSVLLLVRYGHSRPLLAIGIVSALHTVLGPYPTWGNVAGYLAFAPVFTRDFKSQTSAESTTGKEKKKKRKNVETRYGFAVSAALVVTATLTPIFWHLWIEARVANANFLFAVTLAHFAAQSLLIVSWIGAAVERDAAYSSSFRRLGDDDDDSGEDAFTNDEDGGRSVERDAPASGLARRKR